MKKIAVKTKLTLQKETIKALVNAELVHAGAGREGCSYVTEIASSCFQDTAVIDRKR
jgi:hypothetical protein